MYFIQGGNMKKNRINVDVNPAWQSAAKTAVAKGVAPSVKKFFENAIEEAALEFYEESAQLAGVSLEEWIKSAEKGEF